MADSRKPYDVIIGGVTHRMLLDDDDAKRAGGRAVASEPKAKESPTPANKARTARNK